MQRAIGLRLVGAALVVLAGVNVAHAPPPSDARSEAQQRPERPGAPVDGPSPERSPESQEQRDDADAEQPTSAPAVAVQNQNESNGGDAGTPEAEQRHGDDLIAQQTMAKASEKMLELTLWQIGIGIFGAGFLFVTLLLSIRATNAAVRTAEANRAWMSLSQTRVAEQISGDNPALGVEVSWTNSGLSPALNVRIFRTHDVIGKADKIPVFARPSAENVITNAPIGKDQIAIARPLTITSNEYSRFRSGDGRIIIYCIVLYRDIYPKTPERHTAFCAELRYVGESKTPDGKNLKNFVFVPTGTQNTAS